MRNRQMELQLKGYRLTTAEIVYHMPDHPTLLQTFMWQTMDLAPEFPVIRKFLNHWQATLDGRLHSVKVASKALIRPAEFRMVGSSLTLQ